MLHTEGRDCTCSQFVLLLWSVYQRSAWPANCPGGFSLSSSESWVNDQRDKQM